MEELLLEVMDTEKGRAFIHGLLEQSGVEMCRFTPDPYGNAWQMGRASLGAAILDALRNSKRGLDLEHIMRQEARHPPNEPEHDLYEL